MLKNFQGKVVILKKLLLVDNTPSHPASTSLQCDSIVVKFLPPNTSIIQPMDQMVIVSFKQN